MLMPGPPPHTHMGVAGAAHAPTLARIRTAPSTPLSGGVKWRVQCAKRKFKFELIMMPRLDAGPPPFPMSSVRPCARVPSDIAICCCFSAVASPLWFCGVFVAFVAFTNQITNNSTYRPSRRLGRVCGVVACVWLAPHAVI